jgi:rsbT co-antagonist protein RsbR
MRGFYLFWYLLYALPNFAIIYFTSHLNWSDLMNNFHTVDAVQLLDKINENIFIADEDFKIVFINQSAKLLLKKIGPSLGISKPEDTIGSDLQLLFGTRQQKILTDGNYPHSARITIFNKFSADILVEELKNKDGENYGYILTWKDITEFEKTLEENRKQLQILDMPVIPLSVDTAILVPIMGRLTEDRLALLENKVLEQCAERQNEYVIFDFTGVSEELDASSGFHLQQIVNALDLMGIQAIYVGISPEMARSIVLDGIRIDVPTYSSFVQGIRHVWKETGHKLVKLED